MACPSPGSLVFRGHRAHSGRWPRCGRGRCADAITSTACRSGGSGVLGLRRLRRVVGPRGPVSRVAGGRGGGRARGGHCWAVPAASAVDQQYLYDDSARVPCTEPHTTETALVLEPDRGHDRRSEGGGRDLLGVSSAPTSASTRAAGFRGGGPYSSRARRRSPTAPPGCAAKRYSPKRGTSPGPAPSQSPPPGLPTTPPADFWACLDEPPARSGSRSSRVTSRTTTSRPGPGHPR